MDNMQKIKDLVEKLNVYATYYYDKDAPIISDAEYDILYDELTALEEEFGTLPNSPTLRVGGKVDGGFKTHRHIERLWSMDKCKSYRSLINWDKRIKRLLKTDDIEYTLEYKFDGLTINLTYDNGQLIQAATRGNGINGESILPQVKTISSIPLSIDYKELMEVKGEGIMYLSYLEQYNKSAKEPLKNARNAAAGALRNLDTNVTKSRHLDAFFYQIGYIEDKSFTNHGQMIDFIKSQNIKVNDYFIKCRDIDEVIESIKQATKTRDGLDYLIDGIVINVFDYDNRETLGYTSKFPRWQMAYKFEAQEITTKVLSITWQVGRTGRITPVAELEMVDIGGVSVKRATLNNFDDIKRKKVKIGSTVLVRRSNDVIPEVMGVADDEGVEIEQITYCPACKEELSLTGAHLYCTNSLNCEPQLVSKLVHYASRDAMDIETFNEKTAQLLYNKIGMHSLADLYTVTRKQLLELDGFKGKKADNLLNAIDSSKKIDLHRFIYALGIPNVGLKTAKDLAKHFKTLSNIKEASFDELVTINDIGNIVAESIIDFFKLESNIHTLDRLINAGIDIIEAKDLVSSDIFADKTFVITGTLNNISRKQASQLIEENGGKVSSSISSKTDFLLAGENAGSKLTKAQDLKVKIISLDELMDLIKQ